MKLTPILFCFLLACGADDIGSVDDNDRGGPDSLIGFRWTSEPILVAGIEFVVDFDFNAAMVTARNTCDGEITASAQTPVRYQYTATVPVTGRRDEESGGATCFAEIAAGTFDFEIVNNRLVMSFQGETIEFDPVGGVSGLYGKWTANAPGIGTVIWSMGGGKIEATSECENGLSATVEVDAVFVNKIQFTQAADNVVQNDFGLECSVAIAAGTSTYYFDDDSLVLITNGEEIRLTSN